MNIEKFEEKHLDGVEKIEKTCFAHPWSREDLKNQIALDTSHFLVATVDGNVAGYMGLQIFGGEGYVTNVAVLPEYRKQGIAESLIREQMKNKMSFITLEVRESNLPAISLYTKCGFKNVGIRPNFYSAPTENAIIMTYEF
ncbi:ribosomal protein S18-alanine N-acetyltransferase [uncultured Eubacterium sp.]|uniref:ribosomal protein S18-alanine N-acetyltransferase n=1 Tax=uncultured Eubacterium sp. TaxID=165185 RepID=UPI0025911722|nr:ribosomal protein S18-alanine N-acetyltransferase [uncultured Eubacterium sp.]